MAIIPVPSILSFGDVDSFKLQRATNILRSRYTGQAQKVSYPYAIWMLSANLREYDGVQAGIIRSFLTQLDGQKNEFRLPVPGYIRPETINGQKVGVVLVSFGDNGALARATTITVRISGAYLTNSSMFNEGDYFTIGDELKMITQAVAIGGTDLFVINFKPPLRKTYPTLTPMTFVNPTCLMQAADDDIANWGIAPPIRQRSSFDAIEAIGI